MNVRIAVHINRSTQLQELIHLHFAEEWQHCRLFWRLPLSPVGCAVGRGSARCRSSRRPSLFVPSPGPLLLWARALHQVLELLATIVAAVSSHHSGQDQLVSSL